MLTITRLLLFVAMLVLGVFGGSNNAGGYGDSGGSYGSSGGSYGSSGGSYGHSTDDDDDGGKSFGFVSFLQQFDFSLQISTPLIFDLGGFSGRRRRSTDQFELWNLDEKRSHSLAKMEAILSTVSNTSDYICNEFIICHMMKDLESSQPLGLMFAKLLFGHSNDDVPVMNATRVSALGRWQRYLAAAKQGLDTKTDCDASYPPSCSGSFKDFASNPVFSVLRFLGSFIGLNIIT